MCNKIQIRLYLLLWICSGNAAGDLDKSFPTTRYEKYIDDDGNERSRPVIDSQGNQVQNQEALEIKDDMMSRIGAMKVPEGPLEIVLNEFGAENVAEITGRTRRVIKAYNDDAGRYEKKIERRGQSHTKADAQAFMDDKKQILIFSDAGGTGQSYHADRTAKNQRRRRHYLIQAGWRADAGMVDRADFGQYETVRFKKDKVQPTREEVDAFVDEAMADRSQFKMLPLREVNQEEIKSIKELTKTGASGYFHQLSNNDLWHGLKEHGNAEIEAAKGQIPITIEDLKRIPEIIDSYDNITKGSTKKGVKSVIYSKRINGNICYVEVILPRKGVLRSKTMWKEPAAVVHAMPEASPHYTSETDLSVNPSTDINISSEGTVGKTMWKEPSRGADAAQNAPADLNVQNGSSLTAFH